MSVLFKQIRIAHRLYAGFAVIVMLLAGAVGTTIWQVGSIEQASSRVANLRAPTALTAQRLTADVQGTLASLRGSLAADAVLTDVGTLKQPVVDAVRDVLPGARFVGGHPLAGVEDTGWGSADPRLFRDNPWALTHEPDTDVQAWLRVAAFVCELGARPVPAGAAEQDAAVARVIGLPHVLAEALALTGLAGGALALTLAAGSYRSGSRVARTRPELVTTWCDENPGLADALDDAISRLVAARDALAEHGTVLPLAAAGHAARMNWEHRTFRPVEVAAEAAALLEHGRGGGWITAVLQDADGPRLLGMHPRGE